MKKLTAFLLICCLLVSLGFAIPSAQAAGSSETAKKAVRNMVIGWNVVSKAKSIGAVCFIWDNGNGNEMGHIDRTGNNDPFPDIVAACKEAVQ